jgi:uncharacterized protein
MPHRPKYPSRLDVRTAECLVVLKGLSFFKIQMQNGNMRRDDIIRRLKECEVELRAQGVRHAVLFGSVARGEQRPDSDIDIMIELDPDARVTMFDYVDIKEYIEGLFSETVDVVNRDGLKPAVRPKATADAIYAF